MRNVIVISVIAVLAAACGSSTEQVESTTPEGADAPPTDAADPVEQADGATTVWADLDRDARMAVMRDQVMSRMGGIFREYDAEEFATFTCVTCHGEGFQEIGFGMPNGVHPLIPADIPTLAESDDEETAAAARFMFSQVTPGMVEIMGVEPYNPETHAGFGCLSCHATATAE